MTYFRTKKIALSSALERFTVLFGMGRGGSTPLWSSDIGRLHGSRWVARLRQGGKKRAVGSACGCRGHLGHGLRLAVTPLDCCGEHKA